MPPQGGSDLPAPMSTASELRLDPDSMSSSRLLPGPNNIEAALEASCATLVALEGLRASAATDPHRTARLSRHIRLVRSGITELRRGHVDATNPLAYGFVLGEGLWQGGEPGTDHSEALAG